MYLSMSMYSCVCVMCARELQIFKYDVLSVIRHTQYFPYRTAVSLAIGQDDFTLCSHCLVSFNQILINDLELSPM